MQETNKKVLDKKLGHLLTKLRHILTNPNDNLKKTLSL